MELTGKIIKAISGFYYIKSENTVYTCKARGIFRKEEVLPVAGDDVIFEIPNNLNNGTLKQVLGRKNVFVRPPLANLDRIFFVVSTCEPEMNTGVLDKLIAISEKKEVEPVIVITKTDLADFNKIYKTYKNSGFTVIIKKDGAETETEIKNLLSNKISAFAGNTGVGKSTLLNEILPFLNLPTNSISQKLGRGKHTTRHVELFELPFGGYVADTPGFSSVETLMYDVIFKEDLEMCFREFAPYIGKCKFKGCSHTVEKGCAVLGALNENQIEKSRHENYVTMYNEAKNIKKWEIT